MVHTYYSGGAYDHLHFIHLDVYIFYNEHFVGDDRKAVVLKCITYSLCTLKGKDGKLNVEKLLYRVLTVRPSSCSDLLKRYDNVG